MFVESAERIDRALDLCPVMRRCSAAARVAITELTEQDSSPCRCTRDHCTGNRWSYPMIIELGKITAKTRGTDIGLKIDSNVGVKIQRYNIVF